MFILLSIDYKLFHFPLKGCQPAGLSASSQGLSCHHRDYCDFPWVSTAPAGLSWRLACLALLGTSPLFLCQILNRGKRVQWILCARFLRRKSLDTRSLDVFGICAVWRRNFILQATTIPCSLRLGRAVSGFRLSEMCQNKILRKTTLSRKLVDCAASACVAASHHFSAKIKPWHVSINSLRSLRHKRHKAGAVAVSTPKKFSDTCDTSTSRIALVPPWSFARGSRKSHATQGTFHGHELHNRTCHIRTAVIHLTLTLLQQMWKPHIVTHIDMTCKGLKSN